MADSCGTEMMLAKVVSPCAGWQGERGSTYRLQDIGKLPIDEEKQRDTQRTGYWSIMTIRGCASYYLKDIL